MKNIHLLLAKPARKQKADGSRFWGNPALPQGYPYPTYPDSRGIPRPYTFICQINLGELAQYEEANPLPHKGLLSFFTKIDRYMGHWDAEDCISGYISRQEDVKVLYFPDCTTFEEVGRLKEKNGTFVSPAELQIKFADKVKKYSDEHRLFAPPEHREWETWDSPIEEWRILLQVDSFDGDDFNLNFMDCGVLDFLISPEDLKNGNFDNVRAIVLST